MKVVILAGGSGTRLWPVSRSGFPKQFLHFGDRETLLQKTVNRFLLHIDFADILIVTNQEYFHLVQAQLKSIAPELTSQIIVEPMRKNTAPAIALAASHMKHVSGMGPEECFLVCSSDHLISPVKTFLEAVSLGQAVAQQGKNVVFGVRPHQPETGYGYIQAGKEEEGGALELLRFVEKPSSALAREFLLSGDYFWNCGIFLFQLSTFEREMALHCPKIGTLLSASHQQMLTDFDLMPEISIDYALMEKTKNAAMIPLDLNWSDVGSWDSVYDVLEKDHNQNVKVGNVLDLETKNCLIIGGKRLISTIGLEDLLVVETEDAIFIGQRGESQKVKALVDALKEKNAKEPFDHPTAHRPWGSYTVLEEGERYKIKRIVVEPNQKLSLQLHYHRSEHWVVVKGTAKVTIGEQEQLVHENESVYVPKSSSTA